jgi:hypothetical protein
MAGHSRPKDGVALLAYVPAIYVLIFLRRVGKGVFAVPTFFSEALWWARGALPTLRFRVMQ